MKGICICHFTKWQIHPFIFKGMICVTSFQKHEKINSKKKNCDAAKDYNLNIKNPSNFQSFQIVGRIVQ